MAEQVGAVGRLRQRLALQLPELEVGDAEARVGLPGQRHGPRRAVGTNNAQLLVVSRQREYQVPSEHKPPSIVSRQCRRIPNHLEQLDRRPRRVSVRGVHDLGGLEDGR
ncbi:MAG: hypothetical protein IIC32_05625 [Chloroflexi bacterium]|nr:hypothetical protein [Chloroflexota bacterium]